MEKTPKSSGEEKSGVDALGLVQIALRESHLENTQALRDYAEKVSHHNQVKKSIRAYLKALRQMKAEVMTIARERGIERCGLGADDRAVLASLIEELGSKYEVTQIEYELCIPDRVPLKGVTTLEEIDAELARWEDKLTTVGDDAQLANVDLQNILQKQQQTLQMLSNISKMMHDTSMSIIRKIGG